jgi:hypothetical protein
MQYKYLNESLVYDGRQLQSLFAYLNYGVLGDSMVAWVGPCRVSAEHMVDGEDLLAHATIAGGKMLHFIVEVFHQNLLSGVCLQRLLATQAKDLLVEKYSVDPHRVRREGDDIYFDEGKLSISIATQSPVSTLIHFAVNVTNEGTPVKTAALGDFDIPEELFAQSVATAFLTEFESIKKATMKVRWVK